MSAAWWGVLICFLIVIALIITIVILNRGNNIDIITTLPSYRILYPKAMTYLGLLNILTPPNVAAGNQYVTGSPVWAPIVNSSKTPDLDRWTLVPPTDSSFAPTLAPNQTLYKIANTIYSQIGVRYFPQIGATGPVQPPTLSQIGYVAIPPDPLISPDIILARRLIPTVSNDRASILIYTDLGNNQFTLSAGDSYVGMDANNIPLFTNNAAVATIATFQLVPIVTPNTT